MNSTNLPLKPRQDKVDAEANRPSTAAEDIVDGAGKPKLDDSTPSTSPSTEQTNPSTTNASEDIVAPTNPSLTNPKLRWGNPDSKPTYGHTFLEHGRKVEPYKLKDRASGAGHQIGQWLNEQAAAELIAETAKTRGPGLHDVSLPENLRSPSNARAFLDDGKEIPVDSARVHVLENGSVRSAFPFNSQYPNAKR